MRPKPLNVLLPLLFLCFFQLIPAQSSLYPANNQSIFTRFEDHPNWLKVREDVHVNALDLLRLYKQDLGLGENDMLIPTQVEQDDLGLSHYRFQHYHRGVKVDGSILLMHEQNGRVFLVNGCWIRGLDKSNAEAGMSEQEAIDAALEHFPAETYMWQSFGAERLRKFARSDTDATFYPQPEVVFIDPELDQNAESFQLAYAMEVHTLRPTETRQQVYVDANTGALLLNWNMMHSQDSVGHADTKYSGTREIVTDFVGADSFHLRESGRGGGIITLNLATSQNLEDAVDFTDSDNNWNTVNDQQDEAANDAHWGAEMTFDYFQQEFNYSGMDGQNMPLISGVHYGENIVNAFWNGSWSLFGDGNGSTFSPLTGIDVVGHEFAHGVTQFTANLIYQNEHGALNESFSDIFGAAIEFWASPELGDWFVGEDFDLTDNGFRDMRRPKNDGHPDTYEGENWFTGGGDNGGVHTNSGVQNFWFFLMTEGDTGVNDNNDSFVVEGVGLDTAAQIAFRNLRFYLTERSEYVDARLGSIQAAEDLYGACSEAVQQTMKAWYAAGVGEERSDFDVRLLEVLSPGPIECGLTVDDAIRVQLRYYGCNADLEVGEEIPMAYQINYGEIIWDTLTLANTLTAGDTLEFTFSTFPEALTTTGIFSLKCWSALESDMIEDNNDIEILVDHVPDQNVDFGLVRLTSPESGCYLSEGQVEFEIAFLGCESVPSGETIELFYNINGGPTVSETITTPALERGQTFKHLMDQNVDLSTLGRSYIDAWISYAPDFLSDNDTLNAVTVTNPLLIFNETLIDFESEETLLDSVYWTTQENARVRITEEAARDGEYGLQLTGSNVLRPFELGEIVHPDIDLVWLENESYNSKFCFCVDLTNTIAADLSFDRRQTYSEWYSDEFNLDLQYASPLRLTINGEQVGVTFRPINFDLPLWRGKTESLEDYLGQQIEVCFESRALLAPEFDPIGSGDNTFLDNIEINSITVATTEPLNEITGFEVFPNPGSGVFTIDFEAEEQLELEINIIDRQGRLVKTQLIETMPGKNIIPLNLYQLSAGMYLVQLRNGERQQVKKLIVQ